MERELFSTDEAIWMTRGVDRTSSRCWRELDRAWTTHRTRYSHWTEVDIVWYNVILQRGGDQIKINERAAAAAAGSRAGWCFFGQSNLGNTFVPRSTLFQIRSSDHQIIRSPLLKTVRFLYPLHCEERAVVTFERFASALDRPHQRKTVFTSLS